MLKTLLHSVVVWAIVQKTAGNLLEIAGGGGVAPWYPPRPYPQQPQPYIPQPLPYIPPQPYIPQPQPYIPQPQPYIPQPQPLPGVVEETPVCLQWSDNAVSNLLPFIGGGGSLVQGGGCTGYSINVCSLGATSGGAGCEVVGGQGVQEVVEVVPERTVNKGAVIAEQYEVPQYYQYQQYPQAYVPQPQPYPFFPQPQPRIYGGGLAYQGGSIGYQGGMGYQGGVAYQSGASRSLGDDDDKSDD